MRLVVALPHRIEIDAPVDKVGAEGLHGTFTMLPHHLDHVVLLASGILTYLPHGESDERYVAVKGGVLTKVGADVRVATVAAVQGDRLEDLERTVVRSFRRLDELLEFCGLVGCLLADEDGVAKARADAIRSDSAADPDVVGPFQPDFVAKTFNNGVSYR